VKDSKSLCTWKQNNEKQPSIILKCMNLEVNQIHLSALPFFFSLFCLFDTGFTLYSSGWV
jgi:hypothetical protein